MALWYVLGHAGFLSPTQYIYIHMYIYIYIYMYIVWALLCEPKAVLLVELSCTAEIRLEHILLAAWFAEVWVFLCIRAFLEF